MPVDDTLTFFCVYFETLVPLPCPYLNVIVKFVTQCTVEKSDRFEMTVLVLVKLRKKEHVIE